MPRKYQQDLQVPKLDKLDSVMALSRKRRTRFMVMRPGLHSQFSALWEHEISCENDQGGEKEA
jgi:hypothetical protein